MSMPAAAGLSSNYRRASWRFTPSDENDKSEFYLMCDDVDALIARMTALGHASDPIREERWGRLTRVALPGGGKLSIYQPKHPTAHG